MKLTNDVIISGTFTKTCVLQFMTFFNFKNSIGFQQTKQTFSLGFLIPLLIIVLYMFSKTIVVVNVFTENL